MRRKFFGWAIATITMLGSVQAYAGDREIAEQIMTRLKKNRDSGSLKDFTLDMKVDNGVVLFRGSVSQDVQKNLVLAAAENIEGVTDVVDEVKVTAKVQPKAKVVRSTPKPTAKPEPGFSLREALATATPKVSTEPVAIAATPKKLDIAPGKVLPTAAVELATPGNTDQSVVDGVVGALGAAQRSGELRGFGLDVKCKNGVLELVGRASSTAQRARILELAGNVAGVRSINDTISIPAPPKPALTALPASTRMNPGVQPMQAPALQAAPVAGPMGVPASPAQYSMGGAVAGAPVMGQPVAMSYGGGVGAPRYDAPNLPNYAWPGYSAYPNYAALSYPQQYSPSAWPYIGPFYPYPQVPLGWRKVSLEWDDGWWFLDFTDK